MAFAEKKGNKASYSVSCIAFYNLENLFDTINDPAINDEEYLPDGPNKWNSLKYNSKLENMAYAISKIGLDVSPVGPVILGVAEIENRGVLEDLVKQPAIKDRNYQIVHYDSPDRRGVDVGLLYNPDFFTVTNTASHRLHVPENPELKTRDQLLVSGYVQGEKIHVIVNHWPSRAATSPARERAATQVRAIKDSLMVADPANKIIIMGDLNDDPVNKSVTECLGAKHDTKGLAATDLYNPWWKTFVKQGIGTLMYNGAWNLFDQIIISGNLVGKDRSTLKFYKNEVFNPDYMFQKEGKYKGYPLRTTAGGVWLNGYSDHLPTQVFLIKQID